MPPLRSDAQDVSIQSSANPINSREFATFNALLINNKTTSGLTAMNFQTEADLKRQCGITQSCSQGP
eukprot:scaffold618289_cov34-Prasinocladus_malaysianus.AAC.1